MGDISIKGKGMVGRMGQSAQETSKKKLQKSIKEKKGRHYRQYKTFDAPPATLVKAGMTEGKLYKKGGKV